MTDSSRSSYNPSSFDYELAAARLRAGATPEEAVQDLVRHSVPGVEAAAIVAEVVPRVERERQRDNLLRMYLGWLMMVGTPLAALAADYFTYSGALWIGAGVGLVLGLLLFVLSWRAAGRRFVREGWVLLIGLGCLVAFGLAIAPVLSAGWTTYRDARLGLTFKYPLLWEPMVDIQENGAWSIGFLHRFGWARKNDGVRIYHGPAPGDAALTANQCVVLLKSWSYGIEDTTIQGSRTRLIAGYPAGEVATLLHMPDGRTVAAVAAVYSTAEELFSFEVYDLSGDVERARRLMTKFVEGFVPRVAGPGAALPEVDLACAPGYDAYVGETMPFAACYPAAWMAIEVPAGALTDTRQTVLSPAGFAEEQGALAVALATRESDWTVSDEALLKRALEKLLESGGTVIEEPRIVTVAGRRAVESVSDHESKTDPGQVLRYRTVYVAEGDWIWVLTALREGEHSAELTAAFEVLAATFVVRGE